MPTETHCATVQTHSRPNEKQSNRALSVWKGLKSNFSGFGAQATVVTAIIHKWRELGTVVNLPRSGCPAKFTTRSTATTQGTTEPRTSSPGLSAPAEVSVHPERDSLEGVCVLKTMPCWSCSGLGWGSFAASGAATVNSAVSQKILTEKLSRF